MTVHVMSDFEALCWLLAIMAIGWSIQPAVEALDYRVHYWFGALKAWRQRSEVAKRRIG
jgi:hypothetical protein